MGFFIITKIYFLEIYKVNFFALITLMFFGQLIFEKERSTKNMRQKKIFFLIVLFAIFFAYMINIEKIPKNITLFQNEEYQIEYLKGIYIDGENVEEEDSLFNKFATINTDLIGDIELKLSTLWRII